MYLSKSVKNNYTTMQSLSPWKAEFGKMDYNARNRRAASERAPQSQTAWTGAPAATPATCVPLGNSLYLCVHFSRL